MSSNLSNIAMHYSSSSASGRTSLARLLRTISALVGIGAAVAACGGDDTTGTATGGGGTSGQSGSASNAGGHAGTSNGMSGTNGGAAGSNDVGGAAGNAGAAGAGGGIPDAGGDAKSEASNCNPDPGYALQFRGTGDDRVHADITLLPINQESRTIELWAYFDGTDLSWHDEHGLFEYGQKGGCHEFGLNTVNWQGNGPGEIHPYGNCDEIDNFFNFPAEVQKTGWVHISYSYDSVAKQFHFTVNGSDAIQNGPPASRNHAIGSWPGSTFSTMKSPLRIGTTDDFAGPPGWQGKIDELRVWNVYRTPDQIKANMKKILKGTEPGLVAYYHFDEGQGTSSADATGDAANAAKFIGTDKATWPMWVKSDLTGFTCAP